MYGYQMIKEIEKRSKGYFNLQEGSLYPALHSLENQGLIKGKWRETKIRERKYYYSTRKGLKFLEETAKEWHLFSQSLSTFLNTLDFQIIIRGNGR
ncbi:MAG: PadR family transcriptional regulator [Candidatus Aminicenantia bacterium]